MSSFAIYILGAVVLIAGIDYICVQAHIHQSWIIGIDLVILGAAIIGGVGSTRTKDSH